VRRFRHCLLVPCLLLLYAVAGAAQTAGDPLPPWREGYLDIHFIQTGYGDAALLIFPDGTSLQVDAGGGAPAGTWRGVPPRPDASRPAGEWLARYAKRVLPNGGEGAIDYAYVTHLHDDHMASYPELVKHIGVKKFLDRAWPDYDYPVAASEDSAAVYYIQFVKAGVAAGQFTAERLAPGRRDQITLQRDPNAYPNFEVRIIAANGEVWTGIAENTRRRFPENYRQLPRENWPNENQSSAAIRISYGAFDFFTGGDMPGMPKPWAPVWHDVETPVAKAVGPVEAAAVNHHGNRDSANAFFVSTLRPKLWVMQVWSSDHPGHDVLERLLAKQLYPDDRLVFATGMAQSNREVIGPMIDQLASADGHIVIRVEPGGARYEAIVVDASNESMRIKQVFGPFTSR
jgi:beta-lactamase superfamily II metal-dependent hydrolase